MPDCYFCRKDAGFLPFRCKFCGMIFCNAHRIPENHDCAFDLLPASGIVDSMELFYEDALEHMSNGLTVAKIYHYVDSKKLNKREAIKLLESFLENSKDEEVRKNCILAFKPLELKSDEAYEVLENILLSDENPIIRSTTAKIIEYNFPTKSKSVLKWARDHDKELAFEDNNIK